MTTEFVYVDKIIVKSIYHDALGFGRLIQVVGDGTYFNIVARSKQRENLELVHRKEE